MFDPVVVSTVGIFDIIMLGSQIKQLSKVVINQQHKEQIRKSKNQFVQNELKYKIYIAYQGRGHLVEKGGIKGGRRNILNLLIFKSMIRPRYVVWVKWL